MAQQVVGIVANQSVASFVAGGSTAIGFEKATTIISTALTVASVALCSTAALGFLS